MKDVRIGCSGWNCRDWRDGFYPEGGAGAALALRRRLGSRGRDGNC